MSIQHKLLRASGSKCRTVDVCDIFGDNSGKALYRLDGNANDESGNYHGTETGVPIYGGGAFERGFVSSNTNTNYITTTSIPSGSIKAVSLWINPTALPVDATFHTIYMNTTATSNTNGVFIRYVSAGLYAIEVYFNIGGTRYYTTTNPQTAISLNSWTNLVVCLEANNTITVYKNGTAIVASTPTTSGAITYNGSLMFGQYNPNGSNNQYTFKGSIDQVRIFNRAITAAEVATLYTECAPTSTVDNINPFEDGSLKALYQFNGDATDKTGVYNGTATNVTYGTGKFGQCGVFNGTSSYITNLITRTMFTSGYSISMWVSHADLGTNRTLLSESNANQSLIEITRGSNNLLSYRMYIDGVTLIMSLATNPYSPIINTYYHYVFKWDGTTNTNGISIYINGVLNAQGSAVLPASSIGNITGLFIGRRSDGLFHNGSIDQLRFFNKALTPMEVAALYNETTPLEEPMHSLVDPFKDGSGKALYRLDGNALDESGNYNGTATSVTYGAGRFGRAGVFNGTSSKISISKFITSTQTFSLSMWVKISSAAWSSGGQMIAMSYDNDEWFLNVSTSGLIWHTYTNTGVVVNNTYTTVNTEWMHVVCISQPNGIQALYINGTLFQSVAYNYTGRSTALTNAGHHFGFNVYNNAQWFNGSQDQVRIFNRALTAGEVATLYTEI